MVPEDNHLVVCRKILITELKKLRESYVIAKEQEGYGNGRFVRKMLEEAEMNMAERLFQTGSLDCSTDLITTIEECDIPDVQPEEKAAQKHIGFVA